MSEGRRIGDLLLGAQLITDAQLAAALATQREGGGRIGEILIQRGVVTELQLSQILSNQLSVAWVSLAHVDFTEELLMLVPVEVAEQHTVIPVHFRLGEQRKKILYIAMDDPTNIAAMEHVSRVASMYVRPLIAPASEIRRHIHARYRARQAPA